MANEWSAIDDNDKPTLTAVTDDSNQYIQRVLVDPATGRILVSATGAGTVNSVTDGTTTVSNPIQIDFTSGAVVTDLGGGIAGIAISASGGTVTSVGLSSTNSTLTIGSTPVTTSGTITADLNLAHANTWTATQTFSNATYSALFTGGNVGIGTTGPTQKLEVSGGVLQDTFTASGTNAYGLQINAPTGATNNYAASFMGGSVGIGTALPGAVLDVRANASTNSAASFSSAYNADTLALSSSASGAALNVTSSGYSSAINVTKTTGSATYNGLAAGLYISGTYQHSGASGLGQGINVQVSNNTGSSRVLYGGIFSATANTAGATAVGLSVTAASSAGTSYAALFNGGNVGIGTTGPNAKTEILATTEQLRLSYDSTHYSSFIVNSAGDLTLVGGTTAKLTATTFVGALTGTSDKTNALNSATTVVNVSSATAPTSGQVLTATSGTAATWQTPASFSYPGAGITVSTGSAWGTSLTAPSGTIVGTTDTQTLTNKDLTGAGNTFPTNWLPIGGGTLTGSLTLVAGTTTVQPLKMVAGTNLTTPVAGVFEFDGTNLYFSV